MNQIVEELLCFLIGGTVDDPFRVDDAVQTTKRIQTSLLKGEQTGGRLCVHGGLHHPDSTRHHCGGKNDDDHADHLQPQDELDTRDIWI